MKFVKVYTKCLVKLLRHDAHFLFPFQQLLSLWICEEKELVHEIAGLGELKSPWHKCQMAWLENHLNIINTYSQALETLDNYKGNIFSTPPKHPQAKDTKEQL